MKIALVLLVLLVGSLASQENILKGKQLLEQLKNTNDIGKDIYETIMITISASTDSKINVLDKLIQMMYELLASLQAEQDGWRAELEDKNNNCYSAVDGLAADIEVHNDQIFENEQALPSLKSTYDTKSAELSESVEERNFYENELGKLELKNVDLRNKYVASRDEHDNMISVLQNAKRLIQQLSNKSFLQKSDANNLALAQLNKVHKQNLEILQKDHQIQLYQVFIQTAMNNLQNKLADQNTVDAVLAVFDELLAAEQQVRQIESEAESRRQERYNLDKTKLQANIGILNAAIQDQQADKKTAETRLRELESNTADLKQTISFKKEQIRLNNLACDDQTRSLSSRIENYDKIIEILNQVIFLLEHSSIQEVRNMANMEVLAEVPKEEDDPNYDPLLH